MILNLNGSGSVRVHGKKAVFTGSGSVRLPGSNNRAYIVETEAYLFDLQYRKFSAVARRC